MFLSALQAFFALMIVAARRDSVRLPKILWGQLWTLAALGLVVVAVGDETADRLIERLKPLIAALRIGPGELRGKDENEMGPVV
ncbi:hypothetical protein MJN51_40790, partial [Salmonella enterica subsp. enterica serovar Kentucky]|nr:hypothetical protein [Salmonella enterica subsp. enterica serovar Kentucky]